jgi:hypothetical protein
MAQGMATGKVADADVYAQAFDFIMSGSIAASA